MPSLIRLTLAVRNLPPIAQLRSLASSGDMMVRVLGWGAQFPYTTSLNSWLRMAPPPADSKVGMRDFMAERKERIARGEATDY